NMGHRMEVYLKENDAQTMIDIATSLGVDTKIVGRVEESAQPKLSVHHRGEVLEYGRN
ncbi:MAG: phosphoribosylformylglycinamidine cyclo-ligase, partial [Euryarchaeota archaeon]|nr:phosphoribosylformylglycinamidine cyclo-ligase [Euryarchaeota archaeon]NDG22138.1 phosphoribosylformylglycinamidine cyclo-ligase [Euryarchaeota archaeon]